MDQCTEISLPLVAPDWIFANSPISDTTMKDPQLIGDSDDIFTRLSTRCQAFAEDWKFQNDQGLSEADWYRWITLLVKSGQNDTALAFSKASSKHNKQSELRITKLASEPNKGTTRCTTFGCSEEQIAVCFNHKIRLNNRGQIINSPGKFSKAPKKIVDLDSIGFVLDKDTGRPKKLNPNAFARHVVNIELDIVYVQGGRFYVYKDGIWMFVDLNKLKRMLRDILNRYVTDFWTPSIEEKYLQALALEAPPVEKMDFDRRYLNLNNGMLDLENFQLLPHNKKYYSTVRIPINFDPKAKCPEFLNFLDQIFEEDQERIAISGEMYGYCLTSSVKAQKALILYGNGANGKSVFADVLGMLVGSENTCALTLSDLDKPFARSELVDKLLILSTENEMDSRGLNTQFLKAIVSGDSIRVERKHEQGFTYRPFCKLVLGLNNLPYARDKSHGFMRRLIILPFNRTFDKSQADVHLTDKLKKELPGILNFALKGLQVLRGNKYIFTDSKVSTKAQRSYEDELNPVASFVEDVITKGEASQKVLNDTIARIYRIWCTKNGISNPMSNQRLFAAIRSTLQAKGIKSEPIKSGGKRYHLGIRLIVEEPTNVISSTEVDDIENID
ncbi:phage/plasmid primase, P4 family [Paenibacillus sp. FSL R10-2779]|uniref:DNA primase family protein n=1 Tax=Paenibacillus sp. FSL R10-2779 TaxID=2975340 RepID=UPI0030F7CFBE